MNATDAEPTVDASTGSKAAPALVKNAASSYFSVVDLERWTVVDEVGEGRYPHTALFHPTLPIAYLLYISSAHVEVLDLERLETVQRLTDLGTAPVASAVGADGEFLFVGTMVDLPESDTPGVLALSIDDDGRLAPAGQHPIARCSGMRIGPDGELLVAQKREWEVLQLSADAELAVQERAPTGQEPHDIHVLPDDRLLLVNNSAESSATLVDLDHWTVRGEAETGRNPHGFAVADGPGFWYGIVPAREDDRVAIVDLDAASRGDEAPTAALVDVGTATGFACTAADDRYALVDSYDDPHVTVLDLETRSVGGRIEVGGEPLHLVHDDETLRCYVGNMERSELAVIDTSPLAADQPGALTVDRRITGLGEKPSGIFHPEVGA
jgi:DNA-binding beta-propeller fold protein YncE